MPYFFIFRYVSKLLTRLNFNQSVQLIVSVAQSDPKSDCDLLDVLPRPRSMIMKGDYKNFC